ncbi:MAG: phosphoglycerate kinase [Holosporaceae bacterium]|nr:phosphoglycerate kinase [Holosporaceae bacterium]
MLVINKENLRNKKVLVRVDFNVPTENGIVQDAFRIENTLPTIELLKSVGAKIILISHIGKTTNYNRDQSLRNVIDTATNTYKSKIVFIDDCMDENAGSIIDNSSVDNIVLMENLRFYQNEENCDFEFAKRLAKLADFYINEAFSVSHRKHASIFALPQFLPHALGLSFVREIRTIDNFFADTSSPKMCIVGGTKLSTKVNLLKNLVKKVDKLAIGGGIAGVFSSFFGKLYLDCGKNEYERDVIEIAENANKYNCELILPIDFSALIDTERCNDAKIFDIGPNSVELFKSHLKKSKLLLWNGPVGLFEKAPFDFGTMSIAKEVSQLTQNGELTSIIGGGDTSFAINKFNMAKDMSYISTAGGAFLSYLEGRELPGIFAMHLSDSQFSLDHTLLT